VVLITSRIKVVRKEETEQATMGEIYVDGEQIGYSLEQPWKKNRKSESCIPPGKYKAYIRDSETSRRDYSLIQLIDVFNRDYIQVHIGNYPEDTAGCILPGKDKGENAVWYSQDAYEEIMSKIDQTRELEIIIEYDN
jgi:hypothetical protein